MPLTPPPNKPFQRTQIRDGLLINASVWQDSHRYHRQRQNFHYQALYEPGIIAGMGVAVVTAPADMPSDYRDGRWLQIKPGLAIDFQGNPIIIDEAQVFHLQSVAMLAQGPQLVYLVANYVDPDDLETDPSQTYQTETFRLVEKTTLDPQDIELCRIRLGVGSIALSSPDNVYAPQINQLNLCHRPTAQIKAQGEVQIAQITGQDAQRNSAIHSGLMQLLRALTLLSPSLQGAATVQQIASTALQFAPSGASKQAPSVIYLQRSSLPHLDSLALEQLKAQLARGSLLVIAVDFAEQSRLLELCSIRRELFRAAADVNPSLENTSETQEQLFAELDAIDRNIEQQFEALISGLQPFATQLNNPLQGSGQLGPEHPLRQTPFLFSQLPLLQGQPLQVRHWNSIVVLLGDFAVHCGLEPRGLAQSSNSALSVPREQLRSNHEFGTNLLHFAWQRQQWLQQLQPLNSPEPSTPPRALTPSLTQQFTLEEPSHG